VISPHVVASAAHYGWWPAAQLTYTAEDGTTATVTPTNVVNARTWALAHGFTAEEVAAADCSDLVLISVDGAIPDGCCPYFMTTNTWASACPGPFGILGWRGTQTDIGMALPVLVKPDISIASSAGRSAKWSWSRGFPYATNAYSWASAPVMMAGNLFAGVTPPTLFAPTYGGDSGMPIFLEDSSGRLILIGNHYSTINGTSYVRAFDIVKAFVEAHGDTLKVWSQE